MDVDDSKKRSAVVLGLGDAADEQPRKKVPQEPNQAAGGAASSQLVVFNPNKRPLILGAGDEADEQPRKRPALPSSDVKNAGKSTKRSNSNTNKKPSKKTKKPKGSPLNLPISLLMEGDLSVWEHPKHGDEEINFDPNWNKNVLPEPDKEGL